MKTKESDIQIVPPERLNRLDTVHRVNTVFGGSWLQRGIITRITNEMVTVSFPEMWGEFHFRTGIHKKGIKFGWLAEIAGIEEPEVTI